MSYHMFFAQEVEFNIKLGKSFSPLKKGSNYNNQGQIP